MRHALVIERAGKGCSGYVPDLPGCVATGASVGEVRAALAEVIPFHLEGLRAGGATVPGRKAWWSGWRCRADDFTQRAAGQQGGASRRTSGQT